MPPARYLRRKRGLLMNRDGWPVGSACRAAQRRVARQWHWLATEGEAVDGCLPVFAPVSTCGSLSLGFESAVSCCFL